MAPIIGALVRQALTLVGATGVLTGGQIEQVAGAAAVLISVGWSLWNKKKPK